MTKQNDENIRSLEVVEVVLVQCNLLDNLYQQKLNIFTPNKFYAYLSNVEPNNLVFFNLQDCNQWQYVMGILKSVFKIPPLPLYNVVNL